MAASNPQQLEETLTNSAFLAGDRPSALDNRVFKEFEAAPSSALPNLWGWYSFVLQFSEEVRALWPDLTPKPVEKEAAKDKPADEDFGDDDLFGDSGDAEEEAKKIADAKAAGKPAAPLGKSNVVFNVKPVSTTVDLDKLAQRIFAEVKFEGLVWGEQYKKAPVAFGIFMLVVGCTLLDNVETEMIIEQITGMTGELQVEEEDEDGEGTGVFNTVEDSWVQSVDIANFQKL